MLLGGASCLLSADLLNITHQLKTCTLIWDLEVPVRTLQQLHLAFQPSFLHRSNFALSVCSYDIVRITSHFYD